MPGLATPDAPVQRQFPRLPADQIEQRRLRFINARLRKQLCTAFIENETAHLAVPTEQHLQLWANALEVLQVVQLPQQASACLELFVQRMAVQFVEVMLAELAEEVTGGGQHAGHRQHEHQAQPRGQRQPLHGASGSSSM